MIHPAIWGRFPQGSNTYFLFNSYIEYTELKIDEGRSIRTFFFWSALIVGGWRTQGEFKISSFRLIKKMRRRGEFRISLRDTKGGKILLRSTTSW